MGGRGQPDPFPQEKEGLPCSTFWRTQEGGAKISASILRFISTARWGRSAAVSGRVHELWPSQAGLQISGKRKTPQGNVAFRTEEGAPAWLGLQVALLLVNMTQRNYRPEINPLPAPPCSKSKCLLPGFTALHTYHGAKITLGLSPLSLATSEQRLCVCEESWRETFSLL